jgi:glycerol-3-phosphate dehydrogenase
LRAELAARFGAAEAKRLWHTYGDRAALVLALVREHRELGATARLDAAPDLGATPDLGAPPERGVTPLPAELVHALEAEWAVTLVDILQRRCMLGLGPDFGRRAAGASAEMLRRLGIWDRARAEQELEGYRLYARRFTVPES